MSCLCVVCVSTWSWLALQFALQDLKIALIAMLQVYSHCLYGTVWYTTSMCLCVCVWVCRCVGHWNACNQKAPFAWADCMCRLPLLLEWAHCLFSAWLMCCSLSPQIISCAMHTARAWH